MSQLRKSYICEYLFLVVVAVLGNIVSQTQEPLDLENWMTKLPQKIKKIAIIYLAIPGSHNSMTFGITGQSSAAPDSPLSKWWTNFFYWQVYSWSVTQYSTTYHQLMHGIRYFDLRIATKENTNDLYFTHSLYAGKVTEQMNVLRTFLDAHPQEVVILDFQHFYNMDSKAHTRLISDLQTIFGPLLCYRYDDMWTLTLDNLQKSKKQVMLVYRNDAAHYISTFWRGNQIVTPWPDKDTALSLMYFLHKAILNRDPHYGFVLQAVLSPSATLIGFGFGASSLHNCCPQLVLSHLLPLDVGPGPPPGRHINIVIADFVEFDDWKFPKAIVESNYQLL